MGLREQAYGNDLLVRHARSRFEENPPCKQGGRGVVDSAKGEGRSTEAFVL
jgi:hypothetical protein